MLAIGIVVDDAIVVLENIERLIATGLDAATATIKAMDEITGPILAITLVLSAVFIPCCFLGGVTGQFFRQFAVTIAVSTIISAINAITMTPSRAALIFKTEEERTDTRCKRKPFLGGSSGFWAAYSRSGSVRSFSLARFFPAGQSGGRSIRLDPGRHVLLLYPRRDRRRHARLVRSSLRLNAVLGGFFGWFNKFSMPWLRCMAGSSAGCSASPCWRWSFTAACLC